MIPSVKTIMRLRYFNNVPISTDDAKRIREEMEIATYSVNPRAKRNALSVIDHVLRGCGVEWIEPGNNSRSPGIDYVNMGDTYADTVMLIRGRFHIGCWGDIVERGNYA